MSDARWCPRHDEIPGAQSHDFAKSRNQRGHVKNQILRVGLLHHLAIEPRLQPQASSSRRQLIRRHISSSMRVPRRSLARRWTNNRHQPSHQINAEPSRYRHLISPLSERRASLALNLKKKVILSVETVSQSEAVSQSKDLYELVGRERELLVF